MATPLISRQKAFCIFFNESLTLSWLRLLLYRNQLSDLQSKSMDWFLYDRDLPHERVELKAKASQIQCA